jgi:hypothetical protein
MMMLQKLAIKWIERKQALDLKGRRADAAVFEFFIGAGAALKEAEHPEAGHVQTCTCAILALAPYPQGTVAAWALGGRMG